MKQLGFKRFVMLVILGGLAAVMAAASYLYVLPENQKAERNLSSLKSEISTKRNDAEQLRSDFQVVVERQDLFDNLRAAGFVSQQDRLIARRRIAEIQQYSSVLQASYDIRPALIVNDPNLINTDYVVLDTQMIINLEAIADVDIYKFVFWMMNAFPGHITVNQLDVERTGIVNDVTLKAIGSGEFSSLAKGMLDVSWRTIALRSDVNELSDVTQEGF
jgi:hypothetical protein